MSVMLTPH